jgi:hypothetical protein
MCPDKEKTAISADLRIWVVIGKDHVGDVSAGGRIVSTNGLEGHSDFQLHRTDFNGIHRVDSMKRCDHYFPIIELLKDAKEERGWRQVIHRGRKA